MYHGDTERGTQQLEAAHRLSPRWAELQSARSAAAAQTGH